MDGLESYFDENPEIDQDDGSRFISLPDWDSSDGFRLMERFAAGFRNPLIRDELCGALGYGRGVFRAFKNTLSRHPEAEKLWLSFKDKEMKREITMWYNGLREEWGLEKIGVEPEDTADLVLEDFRFRAFRKEDFTSAEKLHQSCREEYKKNYAEQGDFRSAEILLSEDLVLGSSLGLNAHADAPQTVALAAETGGGEFAGYISGVKKESALYIQCLEVKAEYRGLGVGEALLTGLLKSVDPNEISHVLLDLPSAAEDFSRVLLREGFNPYAARYVLNVRERGG
jgi:ribosomal protein S18 acetylase RimI-like enzyme